MFDRNKLGPLEGKMLYNNIEDFYMGVFAAYDENDFEHELDVFNTELKTKMNESRSSLEITTNNMMNNKKQLLTIYEKYDILIMTGVHLSKNLLYNNTVIGNVEIHVTQSHSMSEIDSLSFELGKKFGQRMVDLVNYFKIGIGKEIFDSVIMYFIENRKTNINVKISNYASGENSFSAKCDDCRFSSLIVPGKDKYRITYEQYDIITKIKVTQETLDYLKNGIININA